MLRVFVPDPGEGVPARHMVGELDLLGLFGSELGNSFRFSASSPSCALECYDFGGRDRRNPPTHGSSV